jgi:hypothetical protein
MKYDRMSQKYKNKIVQRSKDLSLNNESLNKFHRLLIQKILYPVLQNPQGITTSRRYNPGVSSTNHCDEAFLTR